MPLFGIDGMTFLLFISVAAVLPVTPGPVVLYIVARSANRGRKGGYGLRLVLERLQNYRQ